MLANILVVEDDGLQKNLICQVLRGEGHERVTGPKHLNYFSTNILISRSLISSSPESTALSLASISTHFSDKSP
jgi:hypothetical protein